MAERIPDPDAKVVVVGSKWVSGIAQVRSAQPVHSDHHRVQLQAHAWTSLDDVGPVFALGINGGIPIPVNLDVFTKSPAGSILRIEQAIIAEAAEEQAVVVRLGECVPAPQHLGVGDSAAQVGLDAL